MPTKPAMPILQKLKVRPFQLANVSGIPIMIDYTWFPVVVLHFALVSIFYFPDQVGSIGLIPAFIFGGMLTVLMFTSIILHEIAHAFSARLEHIHTTEIRLHVFGGYARLATDPRTAMSELRIAIAGPVASFVLALLFMGALFVSESVLQDANRLAARAFFLYLFTGNAALAMFNLIPGLPLDGGRVLRAYLWHRSGDILSATLIAKRLGVAFAYMLASYGIYRLLWWHDPLTGIWMVVLGFLLKRSAEEDYRYRKMQAAQSPANTYAPNTVASIMSQPAVTAAPNLSINDFINQVLARNRYTVFPVASAGRLHGMLSLEKMRSVPEEDWQKTTIRDCMLPVDDSLFISATASLDAARHKLGKSPLHRLAVLDAEGMLVGYLSRSDVKRAG